MRILYLGDQHFDYLSDPLYIGLSRVLGNEYVVDYPYKRLYHEPADTNWYMVQRPGICYQREAVLDLLRDKSVDLVCVASFRSDCLHELQQIYGRVPFPPIVFIDGADDPHIRHEVCARYPLALYFKRDYVWQMGSRWRDLSGLLWQFRGDRRLFDRTIPLSISIIPEILPSLRLGTKDIDVSYTGRASYPRRLAVTSRLSRMAGVRFGGGVYAELTDRRSKLMTGGIKRLWTKVTDDGPVNHATVANKKIPCGTIEKLWSRRLPFIFEGRADTLSPLL